MRAYPAWLIAGLLSLLPFSISYAACTPSSTPFQPPCNAYEKFCFSVANNYGETLYLSTDSKTSQPLVPGQTQYYVCYYPPAVKNTSFFIYPTEKLSARWMTFTYQYYQFQHESGLWVSFALLPAVLSTSIKAVVVKGNCSYIGPVEVLNKPPVQAICQYSLVKASSDN